MPVTVEKASPPADLGEGPHWDVKSQKLYYVDINAQKMLRLNPANGNVTSIYLSKLHFSHAVTKGRSRFLWDI